MDNIGLKIYWVTTVWQKGQIIIPKECRDDFWIIIWSDFCVAMADKSAFWIWKMCAIEKEIKLWKKLVEKFWDIKIWTKYQFVIAAPIRSELWIETGDSLIVIWRKNEWLWFIKNDKIEYLLNYIKDVTK